MAAHRRQIKLDRLREDAANCHACPLWERATQTVFGVGANHAPLMLVGEQPGEKEDIAGKPFVGPAGMLLDKALAESGIARDKTYITNAVKHFKWEARGKRRMHKTPAQKEIEACRRWLDSELAIVQPQLVIALGATAARALMGHAVAINANRGRLLHRDDGLSLLVTVHPSFLLRVPSDYRQKAYEEFLADLRLAASTLGHAASRR